VIPQPLNSAACLAANLNARGSKTRQIVANMWYHPEHIVSISKGDDEEMYGKQR
jgi:hypothetical protein